MTNEMMMQFEAYLLPLVEAVESLMDQKGAMTKKYLTKEEVASIYGLTEALQAKLRMNKEIPYVRPGGAKVVLYPVAELDAWFEGWRAA